MIEKFTTFILEVYNLYMQEQHGQNVVSNVGLLSHLITVVIIKLLDVVVCSIIS